jgi:glycosyltransferase involved in cell wall biosynthesis
MDNTHLPLITIGIPTYNRANGYMKEAVASALGQTYGNIEVIISDNCSSDNTGEVVKSFNDSRIRYFRHSVNIGANDNFNFCLEQASGAYFLLLHDDDLIDMDFVSTCMEAAGHRSDFGIIRTGTRVIDSAGTVKGEHPNLIAGATVEDFFLGWFSGKTVFYLCSSLFNTGRLKELGGFSSRTNLFQDVVAEVKLAAMYGRLDIPDVKAGFRRHSENRGSAAKVNDWCDDCLYLLEVMCGLAPSKKDIVRKKGVIYFSGKNYRQASSIKSPVQRLTTCLNIYRKYGYAYSPVSYFLSRQGNRVVRMLKRRVEAGSHA